MSIILDIHVLNEEMKILFAHWRMVVKPKLWWHVDMFCSVVSDLSCELHSRYLHLSQMCVTNDPQPSKMHSFIENSDWLSLSSPATTLTCVSSVITHCNISTYQSLDSRKYSIPYISDRGGQREPGGDHRLRHDVSHRLRDQHEHPQHDQKRWVGLILSYSSIYALFQ